VSEANQEQPGAGSTLARASAVMAAGTTASRLTGFVRTAAVAAAIGGARNPFADAYNVANTLPNVVYDLLLGGVLTSVVVPVLVRATREDPDDGDAFARTLLVLVAASLGAVSLIAVLTAPGIVAAYMHDAAPDTRARAVEFARWFLPQLLFYGLSATAGAILNTRGRFGAPMVTPVLNNLVVIATVVVFTLLPEGAHGAVSAQQRTVLAIGTTLGVVVMTLALVPSLLAVGVRRGPVDLRHPGLGSAARQAGWGLAYVVVSQLGFLVVVNLATPRSVDGYSAYANAYQLFQLPYAIVGVSVVTALLPTLARHHGALRPDLIRTDLAHALRLAAALVVPSSFVLVALADPVAVLVFGHGVTSLAAAHQIGDVLALMALGLVPFTVQQTLLRAFYAQRDSRTAFALGAVVTAVLVGVDLVVAQLRDGPERVLWLAGGFSASWTAGAAVTAWVVRRRLGSDGHESFLTVRTHARCAVAGLAGVVVALLLSRLGGALTPGSASLDAFVQLALAGPAAAVVTLRSLRRVGVRELDPLLQRLLRVPGAARLLNMAPPAAETT
jgi:putative peptidoglycan lipid II flippase